MKRVVNILILFLFSATVLTAQDSREQNEPEPGPRITFKETSHDFGDIHQGEKVKHSFEFENTGDEPLVLSNVTTTCGCTAPFWPKEPMAPGEESEIRVEFDSTGKMGRQNKVITIYSNAVTPVTRVKIVTNVLPKKKDSQE